MEMSSKFITPELSEAEEALVDRMFNLLGKRWTLIAGRIPGRTSEEIEHYCTSRKSPDAKKKSLPQVKELFPDSMSSNEKGGEQEEGNKSANEPDKYQKERHHNEIGMGKQIVQSAVADLENETQFVTRNDKRKSITQYVESSNRKVAKQTMNSQSQGNGTECGVLFQDGKSVFLNQPGIVSGTDIAQRVRLPAQRVAARKLSAQNFGALKSNVFRSEQKDLSEEKEELLIDLEAEKTVVIVKADHKEELENTQRKISELFKFVEAHAQECEHFALKLKEWTIAP